MFSMVWSTGSQLVASKDISKSHGLAGLPSTFCTLNTVSLCWVEWLKLATPEPWEAEGGEFQGRGQPGQFSNLAKPCLKIKKGSSAKALA